MTKFENTYKKIMNENTNEGSVYEGPKTVEEYVEVINDILGSGEVNHFNEVKDDIKDTVKNLSQEMKVAVYKAYRAEMKEVGDKPLRGETVGMAQIFGIRLVPKY